MKAIIAAARVRFAMAAGHAALSIAPCICKREV
jgi:hypothetical protein